MDEYLTDEAFYNCKDLANAYLEKHPQDRWGVGHTVLDDYNFDVDFIDSALKSCPPRMKKVLNNIRAIVWGELAEMYNTADGVTIKATGGVTVK